MLLDALDRVNLIVPVARWLDGQITRRIDRTRQHALCTEPRCARVQTGIGPRPELSLSRGFRVLSSLPLSRRFSSVVAGAFNASAVATFAGGEAGRSGGSFDHGSGASSCLARQSFCHWQALRLKR